jgi:hypothetical protein
MLKRAVKVSPHDAVLVVVSSLQVGQQALSLQEGYEEDEVGVGGEGVGRWVADAPGFGPGFESDAEMLGSDVDFGVGGKQWENVLFPYIALKSQLRLFQAVKSSQQPPNSLN